MLISSHLTTTILWPIWTNAYKASFACSKIVQLLHLSGWILPQLTLTYPWDGLSHRSEQPKQHGSRQRLKYKMNPIRGPAPDQHHQLLPTTTKHPVEGPVTKSLRNRRTMLACHKSTWQEGSITWQWHTLRSCILNSLHKPFQIPSCLLLLNTSTHNVKVTSFLRMRTWNGWVAHRLSVWASSSRIVVAEAAGKQFDSSPCSF